MLRTRYFVLQIGDQWEVACSLPGTAASRHTTRRDALHAAEDAALAMWKDRQVASEVLVSEDDGAWHSAAKFGELLGF